MKTILNFVTPAGRLYDVLENGDLTRPGNLPTGGWKFLGLRHVKRNEIISIEQLTRKFLSDFKPCWKNGSPQWTVIDRDHGTVRIWGNTKYHGVFRIWHVS